jgi:hypothetical protein
LVRRRDLRVAFSGTVIVLVAGVLALGLPWWLLALGPVVYGVPHVVADLRYLVIRPGLHRRRIVWVVAGVPLAAAGSGWCSVPCGMAAAAGVAWVSSGPGWRKVVVTAVAAGFGVAALHAGDISLVVFAHAHNLVAVLLWWSWRPRAGGAEGIVPVVFGVLGAAILLGGLEPWGVEAAWAPPGLGAATHDWLAPGVGEPWCTRWVVTYAFAQAVHYGIWLRLVPEEDRPQPTPRGFAASWRALVADLGPGLTWGAVLLGLAFAGWAVVDLAASRATYFRMAAFHGYLELAAAAWWFVEGRRGPERR